MLSECLRRNQDLLLPNGLKSQQLTSKIAKILCIKSYEGLIINQF